MYLFCAAAEDEDVQKKGVVCVVINMGPQSSGLLLDGPATLKIPLLTGVFPIRVDATHVSTDNSNMPANFVNLFPHVLSAMGPRIRLRSRYYTGTYMLYRLGIL